MRHNRDTSLCLLLCALLAGCSSTSGSRFGGTANSRSIAVVGDRPMPATTGEPGGQVAADIPEPEPRRSPKTRISGRVVDDQGRPVPNATVRLADGGAKGGKDVRTTTDRAGGFTLNGLRPGSSYVLIAEPDDDRTLSIGRIEATTAESGVEITLASQDDERPGRARPGKASRARPISSREPAEAPDDPDRAPAVNREDLPVDEAEGPKPEPGRASNPSRPRLSPPEAATGWKKGANPNASARSEAEPEAVATSALDEPSGRTRASKRTEMDPEDDGGNPLPPAIDPGREGATDPMSEPRPSARPNRRPKSSRDDPDRSGDLSLAPDAAGGSREAPAEQPGSKLAADGPPPMPPLGQDPVASPEVIAIAGADSQLEPGPDPSVATALASKEPPPADPAPPLASDPPRDLLAANPDASTKNPAIEPVFASTTGTPAVDPNPDDYNPFLLVAADGSPSPTIPQSENPKAPVADAPEVSSVPPRKKWGDLAAAGPTRPAVEPTRPTTSFIRRLRGTAEVKDVPVTLCSYDARLRRIVDFRLPDLEGKSVRFQDLDADYVLLDFWGTWCSPCLESIPHLIELQKAYGPGRLKVVGIACEQTPVETRKAKVEEASKNLGINYPVLLSGMDGKPCPVLQALQIQAFPTTVLVDRQGRILWRSAGATLANQDRLDRVLAAISRGDTVRR